MEIKAVVFDLDKTILRSDETISDETVEILERAHQQGTELVICTVASRSEGMPTSALLTRVPPPGGRTGGRGQKGGSASGGAGGSTKSS